ncbi:terminus macrodomain insulation protein YfbV [Thalassotalea sp. 1_MG-2023]|uniref:terminus macrodomain insulation protein YfbV n=1 Tax=Thalassotalea sp. 1_MG-2023 TaxID=3062680 RepID=UPI0026E49256|nr:terminus macrodomain insulation protein YfbV [Thalassotalea sp. 1_MG-2023]MDO6427739.1 terminus macrodomain insulation protein YfbV [Thalassotalea sp. 1_MG-2023]
MSVVEIVKLGRKYMLLWPERRELAEYFAEYQAIKMSRLVCKYLPGVALFTLVMQLYFGGIASLPQSVVYTVFMLSVPLQALVMLGIKADKFLPPALAAWYKEGVAKINQGGGDIKLSVQKPRYVDLAQLLNVSYRHAKH